MGWSAASQLSVSLSLTCYRQGFPESWRNPKRGACAAVNNTVDFGLRRVTRSKQSQFTRLLTGLESGLRLQLDSTRGKVSMKVSLA